MKCWRSTTNELETHDAQLNQALLEFNLTSVSEVSGSHSSVAQDEAVWDVTAC
jgi:hypothetical protein